MALIQTIQNRIYEIRGERVMLDKDLAELYEVETKVLNQAVSAILSGFQPISCFNSPIRNPTFCDTRLMALKTQHLQGHKL